jgi:hypothetical protein
MLDAKQLEYLEVSIRNFGVEGSVVLLDLLYDDKQLSLELYNEMKSKAPDNSK